MYMYMYILMLHVGRVWYLDRDAIAMHVVNNVRLSRTCSLAVLRLLYQRQQSVP